MYHNGAVVYVHITDPHLAVEEDWGAFQWALDQAATFNPAVVVITGDIAREVGSLPLYRRVREFLDRSGLETLVLPGNHDDRSLFEEAFGRRYRRDARWPRLDRLVDAGGQEMILVDTADGALHPDTIAWFDALLESFAGGTRVGTHRRDLPVWIHHPVLTGVSTWMEHNYPLGNADALVDVCQRYRQELTIHLFCGHYHTDSILQRENIIQYCTPSLWKQIDPRGEALRFLPEKEFGFRMVSHSDDSINTVVITPSSGVS